MSATDGPPPGTAEIYAQVLFEIEVWAQVGGTGMPGCGRVRPRSWEDNDESAAADRWRAPTGRRPAPRVLRGHALAAKSRAISLSSAFDRHAGVKVYFFFRNMTRLVETRRLSAARTL